MNVKQHSGAALIEYALAAAILLTVFVVAGIKLQEGSKNRAEQSRSVEITGGAPCRSDGLGQWGAEACK